MNKTNIPLYILDSTWVWFHLDFWIGSICTITNESVFFFFSCFVILLKLNHGQFEFVFLKVIRVSSGFLRLWFDLITGIRLDDYVYLQNGYDGLFLGIWNSCCDLCSLLTCLLDLIPSSVVLPYTKALCEKNLCFFLLLENSKVL